MYRREHRHQLSLADFFLPFGGQLSRDNRWIKLAELIPWNELEDYYAAQFCKGFGAPAKPTPFDWVCPVKLHANRNAFLKNIQMQNVQSMIMDITL
jgi:hypothetical protein